MAIVSCPECNGKVSTTASSCPHCGHMKRQTAASIPKPRALPLPKKSIGIGKIILISVGVIFGIAIIGSFLPDPPKSEEPRATAPEKVSRAERTVVEGVLTNEGGAETGAGWVVHSLGYGRKALYDPKGDYRKWCAKHAGHQVQVVGEVAGDCLLNWEPK